MPGVVEMIYHGQHRKAVGLWQSRRFGSVCKCVIRIMGEFLARRSIARDTDAKQEIPMAQWRIGEIMIILGKVYNTANMDD